jgi:hypothetical protein
MPSDPPKRRRHKLTLEDVILPELRKPEAERDSDKQLAKKFRTSRSTIQRMRKKHPELWRTDAPAPAPTAIVIDASLSGDGTAANPLRVATIDGGEF